MRIAIVASTSWLTSTTIGGAEKQIYYISTALARAGHHVDLFTMNIDKPFSKEGVNVVPAWNTNKGIPKLRFFTHRLPVLKKKLLAGRYDLIYLRGYQLYGFIAVSVARSSNAISLLALANDHNVSWKHWKTSNPGKSMAWYFLEWLKYSFYSESVLKKVDIVAVQNTFQRSLVRNFCKKLIDIPSIFIPFKEADKYDLKKSIDILWIGRFNFVKGIDKLLVLVENLPQLSFTIVGKATGPRESKILDNLIGYTNVDHLEYLSNADIYAKLHKAKILLNTSTFEGFPNTFLEAWYSQIPVASLNVDPNNLLSEFQLGFCAAGSINMLYNGILELLSDEDKRFIIGKRAKEYVIDNHSESRVIDIFVNLINQHNG